MHISNLKIRHATPVDVPLILEFVRALAEYERLSHKVTATEELLRQSLFESKSPAEVLIGELDNEPVGFAVFFHNYSTFLARPGIYLEDLFVKPVARRKGVGRALLAYLARLASDRSCGRLEWSVLDWNQPAIEFYRSLGAVPQDEWTTFRLTGEALERFANQGEPNAF